MVESGQLVLVRVVVDEVISIELVFFKLGIFVRNISERKVAPPSPKLIV